MRRFVVLCLCIVTTPAWAWHAEGHMRSTQLAVDVLRDAMPPFFHAGSPTIAHCSVDPDVFKFETGHGLLRDNEYPEHFFDLELFPEAALPDNRMDFFFWCLRNGVYIQKIGTLPYALAEATERLTVGLAEYRRWPENPAIQAKCLVYAGHLAHYAQDLCQPLHTTLHYDGRASDSGSSPRSGIHTRVDALLGKLDPNHPPAVPWESIAVYDSLPSAILTEIMTSHQRVDWVYELEPSLQEADDTTTLDPKSEVGQFARACWADSARVTASFFLSAWMQSEAVTIPSWHTR